MNDLFKKALINAALTAIYIVGVVLFMFNFVDKPDNERTIFMPIIMLLLFVTSAAVTGYLVVGKPALMYLEGKKKEAISVLTYTLGILLLITAGFIVALTIVN